MYLTGITYNIRGRTCHSVIPAETWPARKQAVVKTARSVNPDLMAFQEDDRTMYSYLKKRLRGYSSFGFNTLRKPVGASEYNSIFYNPRVFRLMKKGGFFLSKTPSVPSKFSDMKFYRACTWLVLREKSTEKEFLVANAHLDQLAKAGQMRAVLVLIKKIKNIAKKRPALVVGDFNIKPEQKEYFKLARTFRDESPKRGESVVAWRNRTGLGTRIDYVFSYNSVRVRSARFVSKIAKINGRFRHASDHRPIFFEFAIC